MKHLWTMFLLCLGIVAFFLWAERNGGPLGSLPYLLLLLCPLLHLLMHRGHGKSGDEGGIPREREEP